MQTQNIINDVLNQIKKDNIRQEGLLKYPHIKLPVIDKVYYDDSLILRFYIFLSAMMGSTLSTSYKNTPLYVASAKGYAHIATKTIARNLCSCSGYTESSTGTTFSRKMVEIVPMLFPFSLANDWEEMEEILNLIVDSLNAKNCLVERGQHEAHIAWFTLKLLANVFEKEISRKPIPPNKKKFSHYQSVLDNWNIDDILEIDKMSFLLCELHLTSNEYNTREYEYFFDENYSMLLPYEVIIWLKLREYKGLKNPKTFSHPLMQTPIIKNFLRIDTIKLPEPQCDPELKVFLEDKLSVMCPDNDIEIPKWLDGSSSNSTTAIKTEEMKEEKHNKDNIIPDDFFVQE